MRIVINNISAYAFNKFSPWLVFSIFIALLISLPLLVIIFSSYNADQSTWKHVYKYLFPAYVANSLTLLIGVIIFTVLLGVLAAWFTSFYNIPFKKTISLLLVLPIAIPPYAVAYCYADLTDKGGKIFGWLNAIGAEQLLPLIPSIRSIYGAIFVLALTLFPYVYLITKYAFNNNAIKIMESAANLGASRFKLFTKFALPISRPALVAAITLVAMESLADFGVVHFLGVNSLSVGIYKAWFGLDDVSSSARLATILLLFSLSAILLEKFLRKHKQEKFVSYGKNAHVSLLFKSSNLIPLFFLGGVLFFSLFVPLIWLSSSVLLNKFVNFSDILYPTYNSIKLAFLGAIITVVVSSIIIFTKRIYKINFLSFLLNFTKIGYASPGIVIAIGVITPVIYFDKKINHFFNFFGFDVGLVFSSSILILLFAYLVRFLSVAFNPIEAGIEKISEKVDYSAASLGASKGVLFYKIHMPMIFVSCLIGFLLVFIDILKELPVTLILRPLNFNTLSIYTFEYASSEQLVLAALPALLITIIGLIPLLFINKIMNSHMENI